MQSMTAFARLQNAHETWQFSWEIRSVNQRYLDVSFRLPETWRFLENALRAIIRKELFRGKVECVFKSSGQPSHAQALKINESLISSLLEISHYLAQSKQVNNDLSVSTLLQWPGLVESSEFDCEKASEPVLVLFKQTLQQLQGMRKSEGQELRCCLNERLRELQNEIKKAQKIAQHCTSQAKDKLLMRLQELKLDENSRIEQEIAFLLTKMDVTEELDRLTLHTEEVGRLFAMEGAQGRRLDFLMQELNREANTLSAKSDSIVLTQSAVEMKVLIEQMREQIQNIE